MMEFVDPTSEELDGLLEDIRQYYAERLVEYDELPDIETALQKSSEEIARYRTEGFGTEYNRFYKVVVDGQEIGCLWCLIKQEKGDESQGFLAFIYIDPHFRRHGYAEAALLKYESLVKQLGATGSRLYVFKNNTPAATLYRKNDYVVLCERHFYEATEDTRYYMYKPL